MVAPYHWGWRPRVPSSICLFCPSNVDTKSLFWTGKGKGQEQKAHTADSVPLLFKEISGKFYLYVLLLYHLAFFFFCKMAIVCLILCQTFTCIVFILHNSPVWELFTTPGLWFYPCYYIAEQSKVITFCLWPPVFSSVLWRTRLEKEFLKSPDPYRDHG